MDYYRLGKVKWWQSQAYYHTMAEMGREGLIICYPDTPYVCLGLHDDLKQEINQEYCTQQKLPLLRRETGGGVVYLDNRQIFFQLILNRNNPLLPLNRTKFYKRFLQPAIRVCQKLGLKAQLKEPADIVIERKKCSGNAAGDIGEGVAYVGNLLINFDCEVMCNVLRTPSAEYKQFLKQAMNSNLTYLSERVSPARLGHESLINMLEKEYSYLFPLEPTRLDNQIKERAELMYKHLTARDWLEIVGKIRNYRSVKIAEEVYLNEHRLENGQSIIVMVKDGIITSLNSAPDRSDWKKYIGTRWTPDFTVQSS
ncbi:MAG TPA: lipoate--protein ligase family protein [Syntrophomonadaceae bacterium]|nr:lipoate--protein ligase family protein [Syntrophomonadaceae bacterium]